MSPQERESMGLERMNPQQKRAFERWITSWTERVLSQAPTYHQSLSIPLWVRKWPNHLLPVPISEKEAASERREANQTIYRNKNGTTIELNDGSVWEIHPIDTSTARWWNRGDMLDVRKSRYDIARPYILYNIINNQQVGAKLIRPPSSSGERLPDDPRMYANTIAISAIEKEGRRIVLHDRSFYDISPVSQLEVMTTWSVGDRVRIEASGDTVYRFLIVNLDSGGSALAIRP